MYIFYIIIIILFLYFFFICTNGVAFAFTFHAKLRYSNLFIYSSLFIVYSVNNHYVVLYKCTKIKILYIYIMVSGMFGDMEPFLTVLSVP